MTNEEAISILERIQEPEAWEPQITAKAFEALQMAIDAIKGCKVLADVLDGCPLTQPCDKLWKGNWCSKNCKTREPTAECWLRYAEVMASDDETNTPDLQKLHMERGSIL